MTDCKLQDLYWNIADTFRGIKKLIQVLRTQNVHAMTIELPKVTKNIYSCICGIDEQSAVLQEAGLSWNPSYLQQLFTQMLDAQEHEDVVLLADLYELDLCQALEDVQNIIQSMNIELIRDDVYTKNLHVIKSSNPELYYALEKEAGSIYEDTNYILNTTRTGEFTLSMEEQECIRSLHSNLSPWSEAVSWADRAYRLDKERYLIIGMGLGYHVQELWNRYVDMDLVVVESDITILRCAFSCWDYTELLEHVRILYDPQWKNLGEVLKDREILVFRPELNHIANENIRGKLEHIANRKDSIDDFRDIFYQNMRENIGNCEAYVDELMPQIQGKKVVIAAGGPSLDKNIDQLLHKPDDVVLIAVGTVYKLLLQKGIAVDYVIVSDWRIYFQIQGLETQKIPILILSTADRRVSRYYQGKKYLICQQGYQAAREYAENRGYMCYDSGGSVATLALDVAIRLQAESIAFIGLDLAYYDKKAHASGTEEEYFAGYEQHKVRGKNGEWLNASQVFIQYREWMERRICKPDATMPVIDATEGGSLKRGFQDMSLKDYLKMEEKYGTES